MPVPAGGIPYPAPGCPTDGAPAPGGTELVGGIVPCGGTPADHVAGVTFGCQLAPPVNFFSPAFHWRSPFFDVVPEIPRLPTKLARDESRSLPRPLLADIAGLGGTIETGAGCPDGAMVGIRRSPKPSNTDGSKELLLEVEGVVPKAASKLGCSRLF